VERSFSLAGVAVAFSDSSVGEHPLAVLYDTCSVDSLGFPVADSWFSVRQVADGITLITEPYVDSVIRASFYHVRRSEAYLIVDAGTGIAPLDQDDHRIC
jgi:hypothetical protein